MTPFIVPLLLVALAVLTPPYYAAGAGQARAVRVLPAAAATAGIGGLVWNDQDGDGWQDEGPNAGLDGVSVLAYGDDGDGSFEPGAGDAQAAAAVTAGGGFYHLDLPAEGSYWVEVDPDLAASRGYLTRGGAQSRVSPYLAAAGDGAETNVDFGYVRLGAITGAVFMDANQDGEQGLTETGIAEAELSLYGDADADGNLGAGDSLVARTNSLADGAYIFRDLLPGDYILFITTPSGAKATTPVARAVHLVTGEVSGAAYDFGAYQAGGLRLYFPTIR